MPWVLDSAVALVTTLLLFLIKDQILVAGKKRVEKYKDELKGYADTQLAVLKSELKRDADATLEHEKARLRILSESQLYRVAGVTEKRVETFAEIYAELDNLSRAVERYVNPMIVSAPDVDAQKVLLTDLQSKYQSYRQLAQQSRIFFSRALRDELDSVGDRIEEILWKHLDRDGTTAAARAEWTAVHEQSKELIDEVTGKVASAFAVLIGAEEPGS